MSSIKVVSWNVANAMGDEQIPEDRFGVRFAKQIEFLKQLASDIIMIQEIRKCKSDDGTTTLTPYDIAYKYASSLNMYIAGFEPVNPSELSFWRLTLYNPKKLWVVQMRPVRTFISEDVDYIFNKDFGRIILMNKFALLDGENKILGSKSFWTCNVHFPLRMDEKLRYADLVKHTIDECCGNQQVIIAGDCNVFMDDGGSEQLKRMSDHGFINKTEHIEHTFKSFPWDKVQAVSHLDYVFTRDVMSSVKINDVHVIDLSKDQISDHYPLIIEVIIN
jgi:endonuclease/exonuclease/phosphatase family metal-dependent hydrolase